MTFLYNEVGIEAMDYDKETKTYYYPCPCGDKEDLQAGEEIARCPSCSMITRVIYDPDDFGDDLGDTIGLGALSTSVGA
ncbi:Diphthamide biosynthesis protein 3 [Geranomyces variabilis]|nr:Diphthamide biosynthesis protein 3 [Geranomyces variabilis]